MRRCCPSFTEMSANAVFSDIFQANTFGELTFDLKSLFLIQHTNHSICSQCNQQITKSTDVVVLYITHQHIHQNGFESSVSEAMLPNINKLFCVHCQNHSGSVALLRHFVSLPTFLMIELSSDCITRMFFPNNMEPLGVSYCLKGMVRCVKIHFTDALKSERGWIYIDDLCVSVRCFLSLQELLYSYSDGWFFAMFQKSECLDVSLHKTANQTLDGLTINQFACASVSKERCSVNEVNVEQKSTGCKKGYKVGFNNYIKCYNKRPEVKAKNNAYMRKYRRTFKSKTQLNLNKSDNLELCKDSENQTNDSVNYAMKRKSEFFSSTDTYQADKQVKRAKLEKKKQYSQKPEVKEKNKLYMRNYRLQKKITTEAPGCLKNGISNQQMYLSEFNIRPCGELHKQEWAILNMQKFHKSMKFRISLCQFCHEAWPLHIKSKKEKHPYICTRCLRDKNDTKKFSSENSLIPSPVPEELQNLTQIEEMLIARVFPVISVYTKPGGQRAYRGHCINFPQEVEEIFHTLPRYPNELPVIIVAVDVRDNVSKDLIVRREKVSAALHWLVKHNPAYKDIQINYECLAQLPLEDIPADLSKLSCEQESEKDEVDPDRGPLDIDDLPNNQDTELSSVLLNPVKFKQQKELIKDEILQENKIRWPEKGQKPVSEFGVEFLATMAFPTLFPDGKGDPTNSATKRDATLAEKIKHLVKFGEKNGGKWHYRFAAHPRFAYWAFNMLQ